MIENKIDLKTALKLEFKTHVFYVSRIEKFTSVYATINDDVYLEIELSSRNFSYSESLHDRNLASMAGYIQSMFDISPNPDFVFKPRPIDNERYLMYRYIKSIFQIPNVNLIQFADDIEFGQFCANNGLEYCEQEWFKRLYIISSYNDSVDYLTKCSLIFQELYFPEGRYTSPMPSLHDADRMNQTYNFKNDFHDIYSILNVNGIARLYHFTDKANVDSIRKNGILSNENLEKKGIRAKYASGNDSRCIDKEMGLGNFLRLSFAKCHPMMYTSMTAYGLNPAIIEINPFVALMPDVFFSDRNALHNGANIGQHASDLREVKFSIIKSGVPYYNMSINDKMYYQAEILVRNRIGPELITDIITP
ncbi:DarT ssDNA thymidine ADP-ribosyltransferase family protein [uncultured Bacteroides sp.]|uniref:DarT ssDNA thymidine ADP-ribosyltransferase family protein n=1 Tax=uncultured Bacteroides sp. TaxID=162156 RepID=UPI002AA724D4|nr:DarT ssDNA thymidine ADP-ribosyltransferase family protein [uncultured Bacteroides sp.]